MEIHRKHGNTWKSIENNGNTLKMMETHSDTSKYMECKKYIEIHGNISLGAQTCMEIHRNT